MIEFSLIVCTDSEGGIGKNSSLPWHIKSELKHFREITANKNLIMGRTTWDSMPWLEPNGRTYSVLSKNLFLGVGYHLKKNKEGILLPVEVYVADDPLCALGDKQPVSKSIPKSPYLNQEKIVIGGAQIYEQFLLSESLSEIHLSVLPDSYGCDTFLDMSHERLLGLGFILDKEEDRTDFTYKNYKRNTNG
jgi:dihydrofolate reductase